MSRRGYALVGALAALLLTGCESSQEKNKRLAREAESAFSKKGLVVKKTTSKVKVSDTEVLETRSAAAEGAAAVVVALENKTRETLARIPVAINVKGRKGRSVFKNDEEGLEPSLVSMPLLGPGEKILWVHDQIYPNGRPKSVRVRVGAPEGKPPAEKLDLKVSSPRLDSSDPSGISAVGTVTNRSKVLQRKLVIFGVARKGKRIVAAGRSQIRRLKPGKKGKYRIFFIGNPRGARLTLAAPPTTLS